MQTLRTLTAKLIAPVMQLTGYRFTKDFRHGTTPVHRLVYACVDTVAANCKVGIQ